MMTYEYRGSSISQEDWDYALDLVSDWQSYPKTEGLASDIGVLARAFAHLKVCYDEMVKMNADTPLPEARPRVTAMPVVKLLKQQRDELAEAMRPLMALLREEEWHMRARKYAEPYSRAVTAIEKCPTYEQQLRNVAEGIGMTYEELIDAVKSLPTMNSGEVKP